MENFILYEEIFRSEYCISYKGRRKGSIAFVAIHCIDKSKRPQTTNRVRLTHELSHINVVQFLEWYETTNHLWLVVELCTGGSLESILAQDGHLPESCIFSFGLDLVRGLHYLHSLGILFCDLQPSKILLDGPGVLKYDDFSLSKVEGESLDDLFQLTGDDSENSLDNSDAGSNTSPRSRKTLGSPEYLAPEMFKGGDHSLASDFWSLGCVLYQLFTGHVPFDGNTFEDVMYSILNKDYSPPKAKGPRICAKPSPEFCDLLAGLLDKDPTSRMDWNRMVEHPFWKGQLVPGGQSQPLQELTNQEPEKSSLSDANEVTGQVTPAVLKKVNLVSLTPDVGSKENLRKSSPSIVLNTSLQGGKIPARPQTSPEITLTKQAQFTLSARPRSSMNTLEDDDNTSKSTRKLTRKSKIKSKPDKMGGKYRGEPRKQWEEDVNVTKELMYQVWDLTVMPIVDNPKILKPAPLKYEAKTLPHTCHSPERCLRLSKRELNEHFSSVYDALVKENDKSAGGQRIKVQMLNYLGSLASNADLAHEILKSKLRLLLLQLLKANNALEIRCRAGRVLGLLALHCEELDENLPLTELFAALTEVVRDNSRNSKLKQSILPALGEFLFLVAKQEEQKSAVIDAWTVPSVTYTIITRCLREGEEAPVQHYAALIFANVATTDGVHSEKLCSNETAQLLWHLFTHCTADALKVTAISALCRLTRHSVSIFQAVIDKIGLPVVLDALSVTINKVQQAMVTMFIATLVDGVHLQRIVQDKDLVLRLMKLLDATSIITRAKAFLAVLEIMKSSTDMILVACQARLVMYIERDSRRQNGGKQESNWEYLNKCLSLTTNYLVEVLPQIMGDAVQSLETVAGRRHPSTLQAKQLKGTLPLLPVSLHLITSQIFRARVADEQFITSMGELVSHLKLIDSGETNIDPAIGRSGTEEYIDTVLSIVEAITQHPGILMQYQEAIIVSVYPHLTQLVNSDNGNTKALCLHILVEITSLYLNHKHLVEEATTSDTHEKIIYEIINEHVMEDLERVLLEPDPFPAYALKLMLALVQRNPDFVKKIQELGLVQVLFQVLVDHHQVPTSSAMCLVLNIFQCLITDQSCIPELLELGLVRYIFDLFNAASQLVERQDEKSDNKSVMNLIQSLLETLNTALKHVAAVVRQVLQAKQARKEAATNLAEDLLLNLKPVVQLIDNLTALICLCENDSQVLVCNCLSLLAQLYGGEYQDAMSVKNMDNIAAALRHVDVKKQKILLRFVKRMITTEKHHADQLVGEGDRLVDALTWLVHNANSQADVAVASLASDILKAADVKQK